MAYNNFLIQINGANGHSDWKIPLSMMRAESYNVTVNGQDLDSYRDANGDLHRQALTHFAPKIEFEIPFGTRLKTFLEELNKRYTNGTEKKVSATIYMPEYDRYVTHDFYVPDIEVNIYHITKKGSIWYNQTRVAFISYGGAI